MSTHHPDPKEPPRARAKAETEEPEGQSPVPPGTPVPPGAAALVSEASPRLSAGIRLRRVAASSMIAAVSVTGVGAASAQAREPQEAAWLVPSEDMEETSAQLPLASPAAAARDGAERLEGVRRDLANAVAWGSVTASQAEHFYAQISSRIARGL